MGARPLLSVWSRLRQPSQPPTQSWNASLPINQSPWNSYLTKIYYRKQSSFYKTCHIISFLYFLNITSFLNLLLNLEILNITSFLNLLLNHEIFTSIYQKRPHLLMIQSIYWFRVLFSLSSPDGQHNILGLQGWGQGRLDLCQRGRGQDRSRGRAKRYIC